MSICDRLIDAEHEDDLASRCTGCKVRWSIMPVPANDRLIIDGRHDRKLQGVVVGKVDRGQKQLRALADKPDQPMLDAPAKVFRPMIVQVARQSYACHLPGCDVASDDGGAAFG